MSRFTFTVTAVHLQSWEVAFLSKEAFLSNQGGISANIAARTMSFSDNLVCFDICVAQIETDQFLRADFLLVSTGFQIWNRVKISFILVCNNPCRSEKSAWIS